MITAVGIASLTLQLYCNSAFLFLQPPTGVLFQAEDNMFLNPHHYVCRTHTAARGTASCHPSYADQLGSGGGINGQRR